MTGTLGDIGENRLVARLRRRVARRRDVIAGIGDDCAVVRPDRRSRFDWLLKSDPVIEGIHFTPRAAPEAVGHKAIGRVLSDLAAMGGEPLWALIDLVAPASTRVERIEGIYRGAQRLARRWGMAVVGGDTSRGATLELHVLAVGRVGRGCAVLRSGARPGDGIYVTGALGGSGLGRHLTFVPRVAEGQWLGREGWATAMMDVSDGIAADVARLVSAGVGGALLEAGRIPVAPAARRARDGRTPLEHALCDGEDFELLFTVASRRDAAFRAAWRRRFGLRCTRIGTITAEPGIRIADGDGRVRRLAVKGYEHFRESAR